MEFLPVVRGDIILDTVEYGTFKSATMALLEECPEQIIVPGLNCNGDKAGTHAVWLPRRLLEDLKTRDLWPIVKLNEYGEVEDVYMVSMVF